MEPSRRTSEASHRCFGFEADFTTDLRCIPMAVRRKLDLAGIKLKLVHWGELGEGEREALLAWGDDPGAIGELRQHLLQRTDELSAGQAGSLAPPQHAPWQQGESWPAEVLASCRQLGVSPRSEGWRQLDELQRFALVKLSHPGHEHRNLPRALAEFDLLTPGDTPG